MERIIKDFAYAFRILTRNPGFSLISIVALALGIGSITTQFTVINAAFLRGLPFPESNRIVHLEKINVENEYDTVEPTVLEFLEWRKRQTAFTDLAGFYSGTANLTYNGEAFRLDGCFISANSFEILQAKPLLGRTLEPTDEAPDAPYVALISYDVWKSVFAGIPDVIGKNAVLNGKSAIVVGVMPKGFGFPIQEQIWFPLLKQQDVASLNWGSPQITLEVFGRLKQDIDIDEASAQMATIATALETEFPETNSGARAIRIKPIIDEFMGDQTFIMLVVMLIITFLILIIACANVANLLLARSMKRQKDLAIRSALGASRQRIIQQLLTESFLLAAIGAMAGLLITHYNVQNIEMSHKQLNMPFWFDFSFDFSIFAFATMITLIAGLGFGLIPSLRASRIEVNEILKDDTRTSSSLKIGMFSRTLVILQVSTAVVILTLVFLFNKSVKNAIDFDYNYNPDSAMTARLALFDDVYPTRESRTQLIDKIIEELNARPEISSAAMTSRYRFLGTSSMRYGVANVNYRDENSKPIAFYQYVSKDFFKTLEFPVQLGRDFNESDFEPGRLKGIIINQALANREWPNENALGKRLVIKLISDVSSSGEEPQEVEVIGICKGMQENGVFPKENSDGAAFFIPRRNSDDFHFCTIVANGQLSHADTLKIMREVVQSIDSNLPLYATGTPRDLIQEDTSQYDFFVGIFQSFGIISTFLAGIGIYGVMAFSVNQRIVEFGIRSALGATGRSIFQLVYRHTFKQLFFGFIIAIVILSPLLLFPQIKNMTSMFFYEIEPDALGNYLFSFGFVLIISLLAAFPPAFKASRIQPAQALRYD